MANSFRRRLAPQFVEEVQQEKSPAFGSVVVQRLLRKPARLQSAAVQGQIEVPESRAKESSESAGTAAEDRRVGIQEQG